MRSRVAILALVACGRSSEPPATGAGSSATKPVTQSASANTMTTSGSAAATASGSAAAKVSCEAMPFAASTPVPEASGAAWMEIDGALRLVVVADSGNHGAYGLVDPETGATVEQGTLPLGDTTDDLEGLAARGDRLYGLTSPGWILVWKRVRTSFELVDGPYPLGPVDLPTTRGIGDKPPKGDGMVCERHATNCGRNYEGLCLRPPPATGGVNPLLCTGFAASKADGHLYCLTEGQDGRLVVHKDRDEAGPDGVAVSAHRAIAVDRPGVVADCAYAPDGTLWAADNLFGMSQVFRIDGDAAPATAAVVPIAQIGQGFPEVVAARGDVVYRMSDTGGSPSLMAKFRCTPSAR